MWPVLAFSAMALLAAIGLGVSSYLTYLDLSEARTAFCAVGSGCDLVRSSQYSRLFGVPVALIGDIGYTLLLVLALAPFKNTFKTMVLFPLSLAGFLFSAYLTYAEVFWIKALCPWCLTSFGTIGGIFLIEVALMSRLRSSLFARTPTVSMIVLATTLVIVLAACSGGESDADKEYKAKLAQHLTEVGAVVYGAYWCPHCKNQREAFGDAFKYIRYVECDPGGQNPKPQLCQSKGIKGYPTWEIKGRFYEGDIPLETLARLSDFSPG